jgi:hypothetical protein
MEPGGIIIIGILSICIYIIVVKYAHQIHKRNRYLRAQMQLLSRIAEKQGVSKDEIDSIVKHADTKEPGV